MSVPGEASAAPRSRKRMSLRKKVFGVAGLAGFLAVVTTLSIAVQSARNAALRANTT